MNSTSLIIIPTYNEFENIGPMLTRLLEIANNYDVLVVDDNSPDGTGRIVKQIERSEDRIHLLSREKKEGLAAAYQAGFEWAIEHKYEKILQMDADFSHNPKDAPRLLSALDEADLALGSRYVEGGGVSGWGPLRQLISRGGNFYAKTLLRAPCKDMTGGFTAWRVNVLEDINFRNLSSQGYAYQVELKYRAFKKGYRIKELPIHFENRRYGKSKMTGAIVWEAALLILEMKAAKPIELRHAEPHA